MPVAWDCDLLLKSVVPSFPEIKMSGDAADSTDTRHEPDQVEPGKEGLGHGGATEGGEGIGRAQVLELSAGALLLLLLRCVLPASRGVDQECALG